MHASSSYHAYLIESLKDPVEAAAYLDAVLEDGEIEPMLLALKNVAAARRGLGENSDSFEASWETYYQTFSCGEVPDIRLISNLLHELGLKLSITVRDEQAA
ncbi:MAG: transcriptional regulator [Shackletoniella antarctica]|uniref:Transcriptional regulator n=1 Tax=Shackletoniella antarctica TaxID=268115 RepID=A0A2W4WEM1_9CYAN|nr:MAG: transcriptional regulator [Shackletoniella antarctica]